MQMGRDQSPDRSAGLAKDELSPASDNEAVSEETQRQVVLSIAAYSVLIYFVEGLSITCAPFLAASIGIPTSLYAVSIATMPLVRLLATWPTTFMANLHGRTPVLRAATATSMAVVPLMGFSMSLLYFAALKGLMGLGDAAAQVCLPFMLSDVSVPGNRSRTFAVFQVSRCVGQGIGPVTGGFLAAKFGPRAVFFGTAPVLGLAALLAWLLPETLPEQARAKADCCEQVRELADGACAVGSDRGMQFALLVQFIETVVSKAMAFVIVPHVCLQRLHMGPSQLGILYTVGSVTRMLCAMPSSFLSDKLGRKTAVTAGLILEASMIAAMPLWRSGWQMILAFIPYSVAGTLNNAGFDPYFADLNNDDTKARDQALALQRNVLDVGEIVGGPVLGALASSHASSWLFKINPILLLFSGLSFACLARETTTVEN